LSSIEERTRVSADLLAVLAIWAKSLIVSRVTKGAQLDDIISGLRVICQFRVYR
jgi:hypothetical protein